MRPRFIKGPPGTLRDLWLAPLEGLEGAGDCLVIPVPVKAFASIGAHPKRAQEFNDEAVCSLGQLVCQQKVVIGEIGLDYSDRPSDKEGAAQKQIFRVMLQLAHRLLYHTNKNNLR